jgi:hypothetical protein
MPNKTKLKRRLFVRLSVISDCVSRASDGLGDDDQQSGDVRYAGKQLEILRESAQMALDLIANYLAEEQAEDEMSAVMGHLFVIDEDILDSIENVDHVADDEGTVIP